MCGMAVRHVEASEPESAGTSRFLEQENGCFCRERESEPMACDRSLSDEGSGATDRMRGAGSSGNAACEAIRDGGAKDEGNMGNSEAVSPEKLGISRPNDALGSKRGSGIVGGTDMFLVDILSELLPLSLVAAAVVVEIGFGGGGVTPFKKPHIKGDDEAAPGATMPLPLPRRSFETTSAYRR